ncbi:hypothetical protein J3R83DRAFT_5433 [Lanmaoa asiatica]|nr:hypothetical protein J3R83DRAFT_5433 [Lanmaoa asiatica]
MNILHSRQLMHLSLVLAFGHHICNSMPLVSWKIPSVNLSTVGVYKPGPVWGCIVDTEGPRTLLISASICLVVGYLGMKQMYDDSIGNGATVSMPHLTLLVGCGLMTGLGGNAGLSTAINTTAKSFSFSAVHALFLPPSAVMPSTCN